jgi:hypothetical protein
MNEGTRLVAGSFSFLPFGSGTALFRLNQYSIQSPVLSYSPNVVIAGLGSGPHIFGLDPLRNDLISMSSEHRTPVFEATDGVQYRNGDVYTPGETPDPGDQPKNPPNDASDTLQAQIAILQAQLNAIGNDVKVTEENFYELAAQQYSIKDNSCIPYVSCAAKTESEINKLVSQIASDVENMESIVKKGAADSFGDAVEPMVNALKIAAMAVSYKDIVEGGVTKTVFIALVEKYGGDYGALLSTAAGGLPGALATYLSGMADLLQNTIENAPFLVGHDMAMHKMAFEIFALAKNGRDFKCYDLNEYKNITFTQLQEILSLGDGRFIAAAEDAPGFNVYNKAYTPEQYEIYAAQSFLKNWLEANADALNGKDPVALQKLLQ